MSEEQKIQDDYYAPWERSFGRILTPFEEFIHQEVSGSLVLIACTVVALVVANSPLLPFYEQLLHFEMAVEAGPMVIRHDLHHWINDGLMALFFFLVGLEIKREVLVGELSDARAAALPIIAAVGGMVVPAIIYVLINAGGPGADGWAIPMATDIAFAVGVLALLGRRVPRSLYAFLVALAIVDDLGAVTIIALFYSKGIDPVALLWAGGFLGVLIAMNLAGVRHPVPHFMVGVLLWLAMMQSGVHATIAGILAAWTVPVRPKLDPKKFAEHARSMAERYAYLVGANPSLIHDQQQRGVLQTMENAIHRVESPLQRLEHSMHVPVAFVVIPVFALANAGVPLQLGSLGSSFADPVTFGVMIGLILGKLVGVAGVSLLAIRLGLGQMPSGCRSVHIVGAGLLAGIGFTMSIFIAELGFGPAMPEQLVSAKTGILFASLVAGAAGYLVLRQAGNPEQR